MERLREYFGPIKGKDWNERLFFPTLRLKIRDEFETGQVAAQIAFRSGADGIFLTSHKETPYYILTEIAASIIDNFEQRGLFFPVGVRYPNPLEPEVLISEAVRIREIPMLWGNGPQNKERIEAAIRNYHFRGLYFVTISPRGRSKNPKSLSAATREAAWADAVITKGNFAEGSAGIKRAHIFAKAISNSARAFYGRISAANIEDLLPHFDVFLADRSVSLDQDHLDPKKVSEVSSKIRAFSEGGDLRWDSDPLL